MKNTKWAITIVLLILGCGLLSFRPALPAPADSTSRFRSAGVLVERKDGTQFLLVEAGTSPLAGKRWVTGREVASTLAKDHFTDTTFWIPIDEVRCLGEIATKERVAELAKSLPEEAK